MKTKVINTLAASMLLASALNAGQGFISAGYANADMDGVSSTGVSMDLGAKFGETFKQKVGMKFIFVGSNDDLADDQGNIGEAYYSLGYEILPSTIVVKRNPKMYQNAV